MLHASRSFGSLPLTMGVVAGSLLGSMLIATSASAQVLVDNPFITSFEDWIDPVQNRGGNWRVSLLNPTMMETSDIVPGGSNPPAAEDNGSYVPSLLIQDGFTTPGTYDLDARLYTSDDDLFGVVFGYQDADNYFRVGLRNQTPGNIGGTSGLSVQKVSGGVVTQISPNGTGPGAPVVTQDLIDNRTPIDVKVAVNGNNYEVFFNGVSQASGSDPALSAGKIGVQSWAQRLDTAAIPHWGTEVETISVSQGANTLYSGTFTQDQLPVKWRPVVMTNSDGLAMNATGVGDDRGNWGADINNPWIYQQTNGFEFATATAPNVDFLSTAVVVDDSGSAAFSDYQMRVRLGATDNDGIGVLVRAQDDNNFYRINFTNEGMGTTGERAPQGLSVQKVRNGVWTELFRDDQENPLFVHSFGAGTPATTLPTFDLSVSAVGNSLKIQVRDEQGNTFDYPLITDNSDPILTGTVGLQTWGTDNVYFTNYGGEEGPLLTAQSILPPDVDVVINRATGNVTLTNNSGSPIGIKGIMIGSDGGLNPGTWLSVADNYDRPSAPTPGNGSVDSDDAWTILSETSTSLSEQEQSGDAGTLGVGQSVNLGNAWVKSQIEDVTVDLELTAGGFGAAAVSYSGTPWHRSDLNADGAVNAADWPLFYPNMLADLNSMTAVEQALAGDIDLDGDNDVDDFALFKADFDSFNGAGAFDAMIASVPEPSTLALLLVGGLGALVFRSRHLTRLLAMAVSATTLIAAAGSASAAPVDFTTFTAEAFPPSNGFPAPDWVVTPTTATHASSNVDATVLYSPDSTLNKRYVGTLAPGTDDDVIGFVLGYQPGDAVSGSASSYLLIDWKGADQSFDFADPVGFFFQDQTPTGPMPVGLALSEVSGLPTADELWQHTSYAENPSGGVEQLARGATLGSAAYNRSGGSHVFDIRYTATNVTVLVDGVEQFNMDGSFPDGRFGLYSAWQGPQPTFSDFEVLPLDLNLTATVDRSTGEITLENTGATPLEFDYYQLTSASDSLNPGGWDSLSDQEFQSTGAGDHQNWQEAGGSDSGALAEVYLASQSTLAANASVSIGNAYNNAINGEDLALQFRLPSGFILDGVVNYINDPPAGLPGDYNSDGKVDAADYTVWRDHLGAAAGTLPNDTDGGVIGQAQYNTWVANFGMGSGSGSGGDAAAVPEPASVALLACVALLLGVRRLGRRWS